MYAASEIVWAADGGKVYEAKVLKVEEVAGIHKYFIHFQGWAKKYDNWTDEHLLAPLNNVKKEEALRVLARELLRNPSLKSAKAKAEAEAVAQSAIPCSPAAAVAVAAATATPLSPATAPRSNKKAKPEEDQDLAFIKETAKKRRELMQQELVDEGDDKFSAKLQIPSTLKKHLVDEWSVITREPKRLLKLPRDDSLASIVNAFLAHKRQALRGNDEQLQLYVQLFAGLQEQFNKAILSMLLYRQEREQFAALCERFPKAADEPSRFYGAEHLVRFYSRLPKLLANVFLPQPEVTAILSKLSELLSFLSKNSSRYFDMSKYTLVTEAMEHMRAWTPPREGAEDGNGSVDEEIPSATSPACAGRSRKRSAKVAAAEAADAVEEHAAPTVKSEAGVEAKQSEPTSNTRRVRRARVA